MQLLQRYLFTKRNETLDKCIDIWELYDFNTSRAQQAYVTVSFFLPQTNGSYFCKILIETLLSHCFLLSDYVTESLEIVPHRDVFTPGCCVHLTYVSSDTLFYQIILMKQKCASNSIAMLPPSTVLRSLKVYIKC